MSKTPPFPFLKWLGGKSKVVELILQRLPKSIDTYYEPFLGGGAVFFGLVKANRFRRAVISDANSELINVWKVLQWDPSALIAELHEKKYKYEKSAYLKMRASSPNQLSEVDRAARFIYLNKTGFNGLYRVNLSGGFNVPFGKYTNPLICDEKNLMVVSEVLKRSIIIEQGDFDSICRGATKGDAIYFDPPYIPISNTSNFTSYTNDGFNMQDHERLAKTFAKMEKSGVRCVLTNSIAQEAKSLYSSYDMDFFVGSRSVGGPVSYRKPAEEMIVFAGPKSAA